MYLRECFCSLPPRSVIVDMQRKSWLMLAHRVVSRGD